MVRRDAITPPLAAACVFGIGVFLAAPQQTDEDGLLTIDTLVDIKHPSHATWSFDGTRVAFIWDRSGTQNVWVADVRAGVSRLKALTGYESGLIENLFWSEDAQTVFFERGGDLWQLSAIDAALPRAVWTTAVHEASIVPSPDGSRVAFIRGNELWVRGLTDGHERKLTHTRGPISQLVWSPDGAHLAFTVTPTERVAAAAEYVGSTILFTADEREDSDVGVVSAQGGGVHWVARTRGTESAPQWIDPRRLCLERLTEDVKTREIVVVQVASDQVASEEEARVVHRDKDDKFWSLTYLNAEPRPSPDGRWLAFISDRDGWDHLYVVPSAGGSAVQLTRGQYEVARVSWSPDSRSIAFDANEVDRPGTRHLRVAQLGESPAGARIKTLTHGVGTNTGPVWAPDARRIVYQHTGPTSAADLFVIDLASPESSLQLSQSMPAAIDRAKLIHPKSVRYRSADGRSVPASLFVAPRLDRSRKHPAIIWIHGDGITQNYDGWHVRRDYAVYYSFHQYLAQHGYVVLAVDYRGSIGYGKEWRQGHFRDLGGRDYEDIATGVSYLKTLGFVDPDRVGVWGLSYGGYLTLRGLTVTPELFRCGIDVAGVADWRGTGRGAWVRGRLGLVEENPDLYRRVSPIDQVDRMARPLLILHGAADATVPLLQSVRLIDTATRLGKDVDFMMYPGEFHYFHRAHVLRDAWRRVERFFDKHLKTG